MIPFFSIIIPLYNSSGTLKQTLGSITAQSFKNYELVLIDAASTDNTLQLIDELQAAGNVTVKLVSEPDKGIYDAMNKGVDMASGQWLYFMGSDDTLYDNTVLAHVAAEIATEPVDLIYGNVSGSISHIKYADDTIAKVLSRGIHHQGVFYRSNIFSYTGKYNLDFKIAADYHLTLKIFCNKALKTKYINYDIAFFGEAGLSSTIYDYTFYSYHYKFLAVNKVVNMLQAPAACLQQSIYCCLYLARAHQNMSFAWSNMLYYLTDFSNRLSISFRVKTLLRMLLWIIKPSA